MPHDVKGQELKVGDKVMLEGEVTEVYPGARMCNVSVKSKHVREDGLHDTLTTTASLVEKVGQP
jgi:hypothetical protein